MSFSPLQTDLYQLTMAAAYWQSGKAEQESVLHLFFRRLPFQGGYAIAAGLELALEWLEAFRFRHEDLDYLATLRTKCGRPLFVDDFLSYLGDLRLSLDLEAIPESVTLVDPAEPIRRKEIPAGSAFIDLLQPVMKAGHRIAPAEPLEATRRRCRESLAQLHPGILRLKNPHAYPAGLEGGLHQRREALLAELG